MGANFIEIPIARVEAHFKSSGKIINLEPEFIGPYTTDTVYSDNEAYLPISTISILFNRIQDRSFLVNFSDWDIIGEAVKKHNLTLRLITPDLFDNIDLDANYMAFNKYIGMFEIRGTVKKEEN